MYIYMYKYICIYIYMYIYIYIYICYAGENVKSEAFPITSSVGTPPMSIQIAFRRVLSLMGYPEDAPPQEEEGVVHVSLTYLLPL